MPPLNVASYLRFHLGCIAVSFAPLLDLLSQRYTSRYTLLSARSSLPVSKKMKEHQNLGWGRQTAHWTLHRRPRYKCCRRCHNWVQGWKSETVPKPKDWIWIHRDPSGLFVSQLDRWGWVKEYWSSRGLWFLNQLILGYAFQQVQEQSCKVMLQINLEILVKSHLCW